MWEVQLYGKIEQADLATLQLWLLNGRITSATLVRFGEQPWIPAQEVPELKQMCVATSGEDLSARAKARFPHTALGGESQREPVIHDVLAGRATARVDSQASSGEVLTPVVTCQGGPWMGFSYTIKASGFEGRHIEVKGMTFLSFPKVLIDGEPAPRGAKRGTWSLRSNDGRDVELQVRSWGMDPVPRLFFDGAEIVLERRLTVMEWLWSGSSLFLVVTGGAIGGFFGGVALTVNARIFRGVSSLVGRYLASASVSVGAFLAYCVTIALLFGHARSHQQRATNGLVAQARSAPSAPAEPVPIHFAEWKPLTLPDGAATVLMPKIVKDRPESMAFANGQLERHVYRAAIGRPAQEFCLSFIDDMDVHSSKFYDRRPSEILWKMTSASLTSMSLALRFEKLTFGNFPAIQFKGTGQGDDIQVFGRAYLINSRFYLVTATGRNHSLTEAQAREFLDSFELH
jgi:hypothetical protein